MKEAVAQINDPPTFDEFWDVKDIGTVAMNVTVTISNSWSPLLTKIKLFTDLVDNIAEVHYHSDLLGHFGQNSVSPASPLRKDGVGDPLRHTQGTPFVFWVLLSWGPRRLQIFLNQMDFDNCICHLVETMADVYSFVQESDPIQRIKSQCQIVCLMTQQTTECAYFIHDYVMRKSFCMLSF